MVSTTFIFLILVPLSVCLITPEIRRRRRMRNENVIHDDIDNSNNIDSYNIGKLFGNIISVVSIISILLITTKALFISSNLSSLITSSTLLPKACSPPSPLNLIGIYGNIQELEKIRNITTLKTETQILFKQGLLNLYGFNFEEANRNMLAAISIEQDCIMCYWGLAYSYGPNINLGVYDDASKNGRLAIRKAINLLKSSSKYPFTEKEKDLIYAQYERFEGSFEDWKKNGQRHYDKKYSIAMKNLTIKFPNDNDILAEYVDSVMLLRPWSYYINNYMEVHDDIKPAYAALNKILINEPNHPLALHLWIHLIEQGPTPNLALKQADTLFELSTNSKIGHLMHMPSHIYFRVGEYDKCINSSLLSIETDNFYTKNCLIPYVPQHNKALLVLCSTYSGRVSLAAEYSTPSALVMDLDAANFVSALYPSPKDLIYTRYGLWQNIIDLQNQEDENVNKEIISSRPSYLRSLRLYSKVLALIHTINDSQIIEENFIEFKEAVNNISEGQSPLVLGHVFYPYHREIGQLMDSIVSSAWLLKKSFSLESLQKVITYLENAVHIQDSFMYMEPEHHYFPLRHCLASAIIAESDASVNEDKTGLLLKALAVYESDLLVHPNSGHVYKGISIINKKLRHLGFNETIAINDAEELYNRAWAHADVQISGSCCELNFC